MAVIEYIQENPDCSREDISLALGKSAVSSSNKLSRLLWNGVIVRTGEKNKMILYRVNNLPFGYSNPLSVMFNQLLKQARQSDGK
ncbi:MarR family transcriptional regulator [Escherichia coli]|nr:MarR family transcriptional regulator [Escherichia coli]